MLFDSDYDVVFNTSEFAVNATVNGQATKVIFDNAYAEMLGISGQSPFVLIKSNAVPGMARNQAVVINSVNYTIKTIEPDGTGLTRLELVKA